MQVSLMKGFICILLFSLYYSCYSASNTSIDSSKGSVKVLIANGVNTNRIKLIDLVVSMHQNKGRKLDTLVYDFIDNIETCDSSFYVNSEIEFIQKIGLRNPKILRDFFKINSISIDEFEETTKDYIELNNFWDKSKRKSDARVKILIESLPILTHELFRKEISKHVKNIISIENQSKSIDPWIQDLMLVARENGDYIFHVRQDENDKFRTTQNFGTALNIETQSSEMTIDGGNILFLDSLNFVGINNKNSVDSTFVYEHFGENIIWVGYQEKESNIQAVFHIDLFMNVFCFEDKLVLLFSKFNAPQTDKDFNFNQKIDKTITQILPQIYQYVDSDKVVIDFLPISKDSIHVSYFYSNSLLELISPSARFVYLPSYYCTSSSDTAVINSVFEKYQIQTNYIDGFSVPTEFCNISRNDQFYYTYSRDMFNDGSLKCQLKVVKRNSKGSTSDK